MAARPYDLEEAPTTPLERQLTVPMLEESSAASIATDHLHATPLPSNASSWVMLDHADCGTPSTLRRSPSPQTFDCVCSIGDRRDPSKLRAGAAAVVEGDGWRPDPKDGLTGLRSPTKMEGTPAADVAAAATVTDPSSLASNETLNGGNAGTVGEGVPSSTGSLSYAWLPISTPCQGPLPHTAIPFYQLCSLEEACPTAAVPPDVQATAGDAPGAAAGTGQGLQNEGDETRIDAGAVSLSKKGDAMTSWVLGSLTGSPAPSPCSYPPATQLRGPLGAGESSPNMERALTVSPASARGALLIPRVISVATTLLSSDSEGSIEESRGTGGWTPAVTRTAASGDSVVAAVALRSFASTVSSSSRGAVAQLDDGEHHFDGDWGGEGRMGAATAHLLGSLQLNDGVPMMPASPPAADVEGAGVSEGSTPFHAEGYPQGAAWEHSAVLQAMLPKPLVSANQHCGYHEQHSGTGAADEGAGVALSETVTTTAAATAETASSQGHPPKGQRQLESWLSCRMSPLSSFFFTESRMAVREPILTAAGVAAAEGLPPRSTPPSNSAASPLQFAFLTSRVWSQTCVVCAGGSRLALSGLQQVCEGVWRELKGHWYPQLRIVLGDHSTAHAKRHSVRLHRRRSVQPSAQNIVRAAPPTCATAPAPAPAVVTPTSPWEQMRWRSVSSPCFFKGEARVTRDSAAHQYMEWKAKHCAATAPRSDGGSSSNSSSCSYSTSSPPRGARGRIPLLMTISVEAVASATQALLVFLL